MCRTYAHDNGYSAKLYGKRSLSIFFEGKEVMHTGSRNVNTEAEVMALLGNMPEFRKMLAEITTSECIDDDVDI